MKRKIVIAINGHPRAGKDTVSDMVCRRLTAEGWSAHSISSIDPIRNWLRDQGVPVDRKTPAERNLMAEVKGALERYDGLATRMCAVEAMSFLQHKDRHSLCFAHMREVKAIERFRTLFPRTSP
jgi:tRNA uridine 5-carbamoylmethylation protein Kti12